MSPADAVTQVLLIDLHAIAHMMWHVSGSDPNPDATRIKTVERVRALASEHPHVGICTDRGKSFRHLIDPDYKATRPESDAALQHQIAEAIDILTRDGYPIYAVQHFEADDLLASATTQLLAREPTLHITIATSDKDLLALVNGRVTIKSLRDGRLMTAETVREKFGVRPDQIPDYLALVGDSSDNIKGAQRIGPKTAAGLLKLHDSLDAIYAQYNANGTAPPALGFTPALATSLREFRDRLPTVRELIRLRTDVPLDVSPILVTRQATDAADFLPEDAVMVTSDEEPQVPLPEDDPMPPTVHLIASITSGATIEPPADDHGASVMPSPELIPAGPEWQRALEPRSIREAKELAADMFQSRLFSAYGHPAGVLATILAGRELGLSAMASLRAFHLIDGRPTMSASLIRAMVLRSGLAEYFTCTARTPERATFITKRKGDPERIDLTYTVEEAKAAWTKGDAAWKASSWGRNSADMCVARASSKLARLVYADVLEGLYASEEFD